MQPRRLPQLFALIAVLVVSSSSASAQSPLSIWGGIGRPVTRDSVSLSLKNIDAYGALQLDIPLLPFAVRADIEFAGSDFKKGQRNVTASAIIPLRLPIVQPYAMLGYGIYDWRKANEDRGVSYGAGVRLQLGSLGLFAQARRHESLKRTVGTVGLVF